MKKKQIGITLTPSTLGNLNKLIKDVFEREGIQLTKSQMITRLINLTYISKKEELDEL